MDDIQALYFFEILIMVAIILYSYHLNNEFKKIKKRLSEVESSANNGSDAE